MKHYVSLSFDDGYYQSTLQTMDVFEQHGLTATINVLAQQPGDHFDAYGCPIGDFELWNRVIARGHEIHPHGWNHTNKATVPLERAQELCTQCFEHFKKNLDTYDQSQAIFNFPYNSSTPELEAWLAPQVRAFRSSGNQELNQLPHATTKKLFCLSHGPQQIDAEINQYVDRFLAQNEFPWLIYNTHGIDNEGWGPISAKGLSALLGRLLAHPDVEVLSVSQMLDRFQQ